MSEWARWEEKATRMSELELAYAIADCIVTSEVLEASKACGGRYRDEASVYRKRLMGALVADETKDRTEAEARATMEYLVANVLPRVRATDRAASGRI